MLSSIVLINALIKDNEIKRGGGFKIEKRQSEKAIW